MLLSCSQFQIGEEQCDRNCLRLVYWKSLRSHVVWIPAKEFILARAVDVNVLELGEDDAGKCWSISQNLEILWEASVFTTCYDMVTTEPYPLYTPLLIDAVVKGGFWLKHIHHLTSYYNGATLSHLKTAIFTIISIPCELGFIKYLFDIDSNPALWIFTSLRKSVH